MYILWELLFLKKMQLDISKTQQVNVKKKLIIILKSEFFLITFYYSPTARYGEDEQTTQLFTTLCFSMKKYKEIIVLKQQSI